MSAWWRLGAGDRDRPARFASEPDASRLDGDPRPGAPSLTRLQQALRFAGNAAFGRLLGRSGRPLESSTRMAMEHSVGADLSMVRVHSDGAAHAAADSLSARAVTHGEDIYLGSDAPTPESPLGGALLAHEVVHVVQQRRAAEVDPLAMSQPGDGQEAAADIGALQMMQGKPVPVASGGSAPGVSRQRQDVATRAQVQAALTAYLERVRTAQGGQSLRVTPEVRAAVERIFAGDLDGMMAVQGWLGGVALPGDPAEFAARVVRFLKSDAIPVSRIAHLGGTGAPEPPSRGQRIGELVERTAPAPPRPEIQESMWAFDRQASELRRGEGVIGPGSVDVLRVARIARGWGEAWNQPQPQRQPSPDARTYPAVDQAIGQIAADSLVPAEARGTPSAGEYADARAVAHELARQLDIAQQQGRDSVGLQLGANYSDVRDPEAITRELARLVVLIRDALPHHAEKVRQVNVFFGTRSVRWIPVGGGSK
jgi:hypothetical protein